MSTEQQFIQILDEASENSWQSSTKHAELSGWADNSRLLDIKWAYPRETQSKPLQFRASKENWPRRLLKNFQTNKLFPTDSRKTPEKNQESLIPQKYFTKRNLINANKNEAKTDFQTIPLLKTGVHRRNKSLIPEKKHTKLEEYYTKSFLIVQRSPPTVSGYSVTFYHK